MSTEAILALVAVGEQIFAGIRQALAGKTVDVAAIQSSLATWQASYAAQDAKDDAAAAAAEQAKFPGQ